MNIGKLKARREKLSQQLKQIDARITKAEREQREQEQRELSKLLQSRGITAAQLTKMLDGAGAAGESK